MLTDPKDFSLTLLRRGRYSVARQLGHFPSLYFPLVRRFYYGMKGNRAEIVGPDTDIVIDGFTGSGNTFAFAAFAVAQTEPVRIAHHIHAPAQITAAIRYNVPILIVVRPPEDAVLSILSRVDSITTRQVLSAYVRFHRSVARHREHLVIASFDEVTRDYGRVIAKVNDRFGTSFLPFEHTEDNVKRSEARIKEWYANGREVTPEELPDQHSSLPLPSQARRERREHFRKAYHSDALARLRRKAQDSYDALTTRRDAR